MPYPLYQHQEAGVCWLVERARAALLDEQGLGKTATVIVAAQRLDLQRVLVLVPAVVAWNWRRELATWWPRAVVQVVTRGADSVSPDARVVVTTHGLLLSPRLRAQLLAESWDLIVVDEAHAFRTPTAKRTLALYGAPGVDRVPSLVARAERTWLLTGTPMPNNAAELWTMLAGLAPERVTVDGRLLSWEAFRRRFCELVPSAYGDGWKVRGNRNVPELRDRIAGFTLRRTKRQCLDLPPVRHDVVAVAPDRMPHEIAALEAELPGDVLERLAGCDDAAEALTELREHACVTRYRRLCGLAKLEPAVRLLADELEVGALRKVVVFAHHRDVTAGLCEGLHRFGVRSIRGDTTPLARQQAVEAFQRDPAVRVIVCQIDAGGVGITLTAAADAVFVELSWTPGANAQAADRIHRIGQEAESVRVRFLALAGSVDELIVEALTRKTRAIREVLAPAAMTAIDRETQ